MSKAILMSIRPTWAQAIDRGEKNVEIRKTAPSLKQYMEMGLKFKVYLYCSNGKGELITILRDGDDVYGAEYHGKPIFITHPEGGYGSRVHRRTVFGECMCVATEDLTNLFEDEPRYHLPDWGESCLTLRELEEYGKGKRLYGWHLTDYKFYDKPKTLAEFGIKQPPQSWCYVEEQDE